MNSTEFFYHPLQTYHFLSVVNSIDILSNIFYDKAMLAEETLFKPIPVINCLCKYLHKNSSKNATVALGKELIKNSDLYGSKENEMIHFDYVNSMFHHIITSVVFYEFGNTFGYLSAIVSETQNLTLPFIKDKILENLRNSKFSNADNTTSRLNKFSIRKISEQIIFPLFPRTKSDVRIIDVDYIYAQAGLMLSRAARMNLQNISFQDYITFSQTIEEGVRIGQIKADALQIFHFPALMYYFSTNKTESKNIKGVMTDPNFLNKTMNLLFSYLDASYNKINQLQSDSYIYQFYKAQSTFKHRHELAEETLKKYCPMEDYASKVTEYMNDYSNYKCPTNEKILPDLNALFSDQNERIADKYGAIEKHLVRKALGEDLVRLIEQPNVTVFRITTVYGLYPRVFPLFYKDMKPSEDVDLFTLNSTQDIYEQNLLVYALKRSQEGMSVFTNKGSFQIFLWKIGVKVKRHARLVNVPTPLKSPSETFDDFAENITKPQKIKYAKMLYDQGYDATTREKIIDFSKHLIPFYNCIQDIQFGTVADIVVSCYLDALTIIPLGSFAIEFGVQAFKALAGEIILNVEKGFTEFGLKQTVLTVFKELIPNLAVTTTKTLSSLMTKEFFLKFATALFRTVDPGIELSLTLGKSGIAGVIKCFAKLRQKIPVLTKFIKALIKVEQPVIKQMGTFKGHNVYANSISGNDGYGIQFFNFEEKSVELRRILGYKDEMPVVLVSDANNRKKIYQIIDLESGELQPTRWEINANNILQIEAKPLAVRLKTIEVEGLGGKRLSVISRKKLRNGVLATKNNNLLPWRNRVGPNVILDLLKNYVLEDRHIQLVLEHFTTHNQLPEWINNYKLVNVADYERLRFSNLVEDTLLTEEEAVVRINKFYNQLYKSNPPYDYGEKMFEEFKAKQLHFLVNLEDFCAIRNYLFYKTGLTSSPEGWFTLQAFYRVAMRFVDMPSYAASACFYNLKKATSEIVNTEKVGMVKSFDYLTNVESRVTQSLEKIENIADDNFINVLYEIHVENHYMVVDVRKMFAYGKTSAVLLPNMKFVIEKAGFEYINGHRVYKVTLNSCALNKMLFIASLNKNTQILENRIKLYNNYLDDFDLNLFN